MEQIKLFSHSNSCMPVGSHIKSESNSYMMKSDNLGEVFDNTESSPSMAKALYDHSQEAIYEDSLRFNRNEIEFSDPDDVLGLGVDFDDQPIPIASTESATQNWRNCTFNFLRLSSKPADEKYSLLQSPLRSGNGLAVGDNVQPRPVTAVSNGLRAVKGKKYNRASSVSTVVKTVFSSIKGSLHIFLTSLRKWRKSSKFAWDSHTTLQTE